MLFTECNTRLEKCPKCDYERQPEDDERFSQAECPRCGIVYGKYMQSEMQYRAAKASMEKDGSQNQKLTKGRSNRWISCVLVGGLLLSVAAYAIHFRDSKRWDQLFAEAVNLSNSGHFAESLELANSALAKAERERKIDRKKILEIRLLTAKCEEELGQYQSALKTLEHVKADQEQIYGVNHLEVRKTLSAMASLYYKMGETKKGERLIGQIVSEDEKEGGASVKAPASAFGHTVSEGYAFHRDSRADNVQSHNVNNHSSQKSVKACIDQCQSDFDSCYGSINHFQSPDSSVFRSIDAYNNESSRLASNIQSQDRMCEQQKKTCERLCAAEAK